MNQPIFDRKHELFHESVIRFIETDVAPRMEA